MRVSQVTAVVLLLAVASPAARGELVFGPATHLGPPISSDATEQSPFLSAGGLSLYLDRTPTDAGGTYVWSQESIQVLERASVDVAFTGPARELNPGHGAFTTRPTVTADGLSLFYSSQPDPFEESDMYEVTRESADVDFDFAADSVKLGPAVNYPGGWDEYGQISPDGLTLVFTSDRPGGYGPAFGDTGDIWMATRATRTSAFNLVENMGPQINTAGNEGSPFLSSDGLALIFNSSTRPGGQGGVDLWVSYQDGSEGWQEPVNLGPNVNSAADDWTASLSADMSTLYFASTREGGIPNHPIYPAFAPQLDLYQASVTPIPEPSTLLLVVIALGVVGGWRKWKHAA
jgi:hypothetical protein